LLLVREAGGVTGPFLSEGGLHRGGAVLASTPAVAGVLAHATGIPLLTGPDLLTQPSDPILKSA
jgi:myo-inositol-1(or 4)-monophosphatase